MQATLDDHKIRKLTVQASRFKDPAMAREAALKAWRTIRTKKRRKFARGSASLLSFEDRHISLPPDVAVGTFRISAPLIKNSKLTYVSRGGVGKNLSDGWALNFAIGCTFGCRFCYVDEIHKKWGEQRAGNIVYRDWGSYFSVPDNLDQAIAKTEWEKWQGEEVMLSSTHDPYLPQLRGWTRKILEAALPNGVRFCIQTRSPLVEKDFDLVAQYRRQIRLQVSIATYHDELARIIEPRVVPPRRRMEIINQAGKLGISTGIIIAPVFPPVKIRENVASDLDAIAQDVVEARPRYIFGESVHVRGINQAYSESALGEKLNLDGFDNQAGRLFYSTLRRYNLRGTWWPEHHHR